MLLCGHPTAPIHNIIIIVTCRLTHSYGYIGISLGANWKTHRIIEKKWQEMEKHKLKKLSGSF